MVYTRHCNAPPICTDCFLVSWFLGFLLLLPIVAANQQSWISGFTSYLQRIAVPVTAVHAQFRAIGPKSARRRRHASGGPWGTENSWKGLFNIGSRGSDVVNDITQRQQILMSSR